MTLLHFAVVLITVVTCLIVGVLLALAVVAMIGGAPMRTLEIHMAKRQMRAIKRQTVRDIFDAEARYRHEHDDAIDGTVADSE